MTDVWHDGAFEKVIAAAVEAVNAGAELVAEISRRNTPKLTGALAASTRVVRANKGNHTARVIVGEGIDYGYLVHERGRFSHPTGGDKFLERASTEVGAIGGTIRGSFGV